MRQAILMGLALLAAPASAFAACKATRMADLPVTMSGRRALISGQFGGREARFILDSGAFYSTLSHATAAEFGLREQPLPNSFRLRGINGDTSAGYALAPSFTLAAIPLPKAEFLVGGTDTGFAGLIGRNILDLWDIEYDLAHGAVRLIKTEGCKGVNLAYWAKDKPVTTVSLERNEDSLFRQPTVGKVMLNGVAIRAEFDSGAESSLITLAAAKRAGVTPMTAGVVQAGFTSGLGTRQVRTWRARFDKIDIGGEAISHPTIQIGDTEISNADMLIGIDFFLTHRIFVSNATRTMWITYEGGPMFGLSPRGAVTAEGKPLDLTDQASEPTTAEGYSRRGGALASAGKTEQALGDFDHAIALAPTEPRYLLQRARARLANRQRPAAMADIDAAIALAPRDADVRLLRARLRLTSDDRTGAAEDARAADGALAPTSDERMTLAALYDGLDQPERAVANYDLWLKAHAEDAGRAAALNGRCWARGLLGQALDKALADCNAALRLRPGDASMLDSRGLVRLRRGELDAALADYDAALRAEPKMAWSLYARAIVKARAGKKEEAEKDRAAALAIDPRIADRAKRIGLE